MFRPFAVVALTSVLIGAAPVSTHAEWRQIGILQSESRNVSIGVGEARIVSAVKFRDIYKEGMMVLDTAKIRQLYPGWDRHSDIVTMYKLTDEGYKQTDWRFGQNVEKVPLKGDTISPSLGVFDQMGTRRANIPEDLKKLLTKDAPVVAAVMDNLDSDPEFEIVMVIAGPWDAQKRGALNNVSIMDHSKGIWVPVKVFELPGLRRSGPLEVRDVTGDGKLDIVYRSFIEHPGYFNVEARVFSSQPGLPEATEPLEFNPSLKQ